MNFQTLGDVPEAGSNAPQGESEPQADDSVVEVEKKPQISRETVGLLGVLLACGGVLFFMYLRNGPAWASGSSSIGAVPAAGSGGVAAVTEFLGNGEEHVTTIQKALQSTDTVVKEFGSYPSRAQVPLTALRTNPFRQAQETTGPTEPESEGAARRRHEQERLDVQKAAEALQLQSVLRGPHDACLINNTLYEEGQQIDGFVIEQINPDSVIVRNLTYRFELRMGR